MGNRGDLGRNRGESKQESLGSVAVDSDNLENITEAGRVEQGSQGLKKNCISKEWAPFVGFSRSVSLIPPLEEQDDLRRKARMTGLDCAVMSNLINTQTHPHDSRMMLRTRVQGREARGRIGEGGRETKNRQKLHKSCKRDVGNGGDLGGNRKKRRQEGLGSVAADPDNLENRKEAGQEHKVPRVNVRTV